MVVGYFSETDIDEYLMLLKLSVIIRLSREVIFLLPKKLGLVILLNKTFGFAIIIKVKKMYVVASEACVEESYVSLQHFGEAIDRSCK
jgi:hypothetical protein